MWNEKACYFCGIEHEVETEDGREAKRKCLKEALGSDYEE